MSELVSFNNYMSRCIEDKIHNCTNNGQCSRCGGCCSRLLPLTETEVKKIRKYINKNSISERIQKPPVVAVKPTLDMTCPFLSITDGCTKCMIYEVRPEICQKFLCADESVAKELRSDMNNAKVIIDMRAEFYGHIDCRLLILESLL